MKLYKNPGTHHTHNTNTAAHSEPPGDLTLTLSRNQTVSAPTLAR